MSAFTAALGTLAADPNMGIDVEYSDDGGGLTWRTVRAFHTPTVNDLGVETRTEAIEVVVLSRDIPSPARGDLVRFGGQTYLIDATRPDILRTSTTLTLAEQG